MRLRLMATAFLYNDSKLLMLKREEDRKLAPGLWTGVGGHIEPDELSSPRLACLREIQEETGIEATNIADLKLLYILIRVKGDEIRQQFVYFGNTEKTELIQTTEGELHWVDVSEIFKLMMPRILHLMMEHYFERQNDDGHIYVGTLTLTNDQKTEIQWSRLLDPEGL